MERNIRPRSSGLNILLEHVHVSGEEGRRLTVEVVDSTTDLF